MKRIFQRTAAFFGHWINGTKGAISLFLALLMTPILSLSLLLVESARYQSVVQIMEDLQDLCNFSTISNYDSYMENRFGLLAVDQKTEIKTSFQTYLEENIAAMGETVSLMEDTTAEGVFPLSNSAILRQQIVEYGEVSVLTKTLYEGLDIQDLLDSLLEKVNFLDDLNDTIDLLNTTVDMASTMTKILETTKELIEAHDDYKTAWNAYKAAYSSKNDDGEPIGFQQDALSLIDALSAAEAALEADADVAEAWDDKDVKDSVSAMKKSCADYRGKASTLKSKITAVRDKASALNAAVTTLDEKINKFSNDQEKTDEKKYFDTSATNWTLVIAKDIYDRLSNVVTESFIQDATGDIDELTAQITKLKTLEDDPKTVKSSWTVDTVKAEYGPITISFTSISTVLKGVVSELTEDVDVGDDANLLSNLLDLVNKLLNIQLWYDKSLDSIVSDASFLSTACNKLSTSDQVLVVSIETMASAAETFKLAMEEDNGLWKLLELMAAIGEVIGAVAVFLGAVVVWATELLTGIVKTIAELSNPNDLYNQLLMYGYCAYNMPNRVTCVTGKALTGYSYQSIFLMNGGDITEYDSQTLGGSLFESLPDQNGTDPAFKGAVQEYLIVGSESEYINQFNAFVKIYLFRMLLNLPLVLRDKEWALAGPYAIVIKVLVALAEPFLDAVFLVNGQTENLMKDKLYISPSGVPGLLKKLTNITAGKALAELLNNEVDKKEEDKKKDNQKDSDKKPGGEDDKGKGKKFFKCTYGDHLYILAFVMSDDNVYLERLKNVIHMEAAQYYKSSGESFSLEQAYTYVHSTVEYTANPVFNIDLLTDGGLFDVSSGRYNGY